MSAVLESPKINEKQKFNFQIEVVERVRLANISWETYERILADHDNVSNPHFAYSNGELEIIVLGYQHEIYKSRLSELLIEIARILEIDYESSASTTFRKEKQKKGFEGDESFYFKNAELIRPKKEIDLTQDPPPELVLEIDITHGSLSKFPIYEALEIEEIWRFDGDEVKFYRLEDENYKEVSESVCLPKVKSEIVTTLLFAAQKMKRLDWLKLIHESIKKG